MSQAVSESFEWQARACTAMGSTFSAGILRAAGADYDAGGPVAGLFGDWETATREALIDAATPLRFLGALHDRALSGEAPWLAAHYPGEGAPDAEAAFAAARSLIEADPSDFSAFMAHEPQTNEVGRSGALLGGFLTVAGETGLPLSTVELGASAGLNQIWDRFGYRLGPGNWGDASSPLQLAPEWTGPLPPLSAPVRVARRCACDRKPVDLTDPVQRRRLIAYVWPDQTERLARVKAATQLALENGVAVEAMDAQDFAAARGAPAPGLATVIYHSVFWQYMPPRAQVATTAAIATHGAAATREAPLAWLRLEPKSDDPTTMLVSLTTWPGGETRVLAQSHPHGTRIHWAG